MSGIANLHPLVQAFLGGCVAALSTAIPLVDDGFVVSEILSVALAGLVGSGLTAAIPNRTPKAFR